MPDQQNRPNNRKTPESEDAASPSGEDEITSLSNLKSPGNDLIGQFRQLEELRAKGLVSDVEYEATRAALEGL